MDRTDKNKITKNLVMIVESLTVDEIFMAHLQQEGILTNAMADDLKVLYTSHKLQ